MKYFLPLIACFIWSACQNGTSTKTISVKPTYLTEINMQRPGFFFLSKDYLYLSDLDSKDTMVQVYDKEKVNQIGIISCEASKIVIHQLGFGLDGNVIVSDLSSENWGIYSASQEDAWLKLGANPYPKSAICQIGPTRYVFLRPTAENKPFEILDPVKQTTLTSFGHFNLMDSLSFTNFDEVFLGELTYSPDSLYLLYRGCNLPLLQLYKQESGSFTFIAEKEFYPYKCSLHDSTLSILTDPSNHILKASLTKDYIVLLNNYLPSAKNAGQEPQFVSQLIILNKRLDQLALANLSDYTYTLTSDSRSNDIYLISKNEGGFYLGKLENLSVD
ncbi:hypothetical protein [Parabacteroides pacaensis]|uniref:hypothetical protein n=1 Tax=Parabacteroides pacaensis TaxID=2086575 RepID=UPI000D0FC755|nr:hypothetical protein [Parabacteroides pacaensis]